MQRQRLCFTDFEGKKSRKEKKMKRLFAGRTLKRTAAVIMASVTLAAMPANGVLPVSTVKADEVLPGYVRSVYTNELVPAEQTVVRPIAVMMPTDKVAQPSYGISSADVLYEIMEEGNISRQMAVISNWTGLSKIGNVRSCRAYYLPEATEWDPILIHFGGVVYMKDRITAPDIRNEPVRRGRRSARLQCIFQDIGQKSAAQCVHNGTRYCQCLRPAWIFAEYQGRILQCEAFYLCKRHQYA